MSVLDKTLSKKTLPNEPLKWLTADGSLTALLEIKAGRPLRVEPAFEGYRMLTLLQKKQLGYQGRQLNRPVMAWVRESLLYGNSDQPWIAARSIFPLISLKGEAKRLQYLGCTPIGYVLFKRQSRLPYCRVIDLTHIGWRRSTIYTWYKRELIISETFLTGFFKDDL
ncbi:chorismate lyase [Psychrobacter sp.]|uniref:chorismate--pyruvate lyase family protein n=1 Tax=Psychrobacter sp. TaxID=56811 RepID=UPI00344F906C